MLQSISQLLERSMPPSTTPPPFPTPQQGLLLFIRWVFQMRCQESKPALCREGQDACGASPLAGYPHLPRATPAGPEGAKCTSEWDLGTCFIGNPGPLDLSSSCIMMHKYIWNYLHKVSQNRCCSVSFGLRGVLATNEGVSSFGPSKGPGIASCLGPCQPSFTQRLHHDLLQEPTASKRSWEPWSHGHPGSSGYFLHSERSWP